MCSNLRFWTAIVSLLCLLLTCAREGGAHAESVLPGIYQDWLVSPDMQKDQPAFCLPGNQNECFSTRLRMAGESGWSTAHVDSTCGLLQFSTEGSGAHHTYSISLVGRPEEKLTVVIGLPRQMMADRFQLDNLIRSKAASHVTVVGETDVEKPAWRSSGAMVQLQVRLSEVGKANLSVPVHLRYIEPSEESSRAIIAPPPVVISKLGICTSVKQPEGIAEAQFEAPTGNPDVQLFTTVITLLAVFWFAASVVKESASAQAYSKTKR